MRATFNLDALARQEARRNLPSASSTAWWKSGARSGIQPCCRGYVRPLPGSGRQLCGSLASISTDPQMAGLTLVLRGETPANWAVADIGH